MTKRMAVALASGLALAACGGSSGGNAAVSKTFTYGSAVQASSTQASALDGQLSSALSLKAAPDANSAQELAGFSGVTSTLLGSSAITLGSAGPAQQQLLAAGRSAALSKALSASNVTFDNEATCVATTTAKVTMTGCTLTLTDTSMSGKVTVDGWAAYDPALAKVSWDLTLGSTMTFTSISPPGSATIRFHESGALALTDTTLKGDLLAEMSMTASGQGQTMSAAVSEAVDLDVTYAGTPPCVTGGTLEAKRVWTALPDGASGPEYANGGAKVTWTGACGSATVALSN